MRNTVHSIRGRMAPVMVLVLLLASPGDIRAEPQDTLRAKPRYAEAIAAFLANDRVEPPPKEAILFVGSSIFRQWTTLKEQMAPLPVFNRAFGGSRTDDQLFYLDTIVIPYRPRVIVYYCGSNDINAGFLPADIFGRIREFFERVHRSLPGTRILFVSINRAPQKKERWDRVDSTNAMVKRYSARNSHLGYVDVNPALFDAHGEPRLDFYKPDRLHLLPPAYEEFTKILKPVLEEVWREAR
jgi:hypothetical protein